jgi:cellulose synthase/poly-beta-1,6-N-acetylglucosamine synthase-like glycosyltransferase
MPVVDVIAWLSSAIAIVPLSILITELLAGQQAQRDETPLIEEWPKSVVVMPAHNEATIIGETVRTMLNRLPPNSELLVIADNCDDETAHLAREAGARVAVRNDSSRRGKGYALAHAVEVMLEDPPSYIIVLDADCQSTEGSLAHLVKAAVRSGLPVQSANVMVAPLSSTPMVQISNFAFYVKNIIRQRGMMRIGGTAILTGTGFALSWKQFCFAAVPTGEIVEDLVMGLALAARREPTQFVEAARVESPAAGQADTLNQRQRWEHGYMSTAWKRALPSLWKGLRDRNRALFWTGFHLLVPPLVVLVMVSTLLFAGQLGLVIFGASKIPIVALTILLLALFCLLVASWLGGGSKFLSFQAVRSIPGYLAWKLPMYRKLAGKRQNVWNRTPREGE